MGKRSKKGRSVKKNNQMVVTEPEELSKAPHSFVIHRGVVGGYVLELVKDFKNVMEPFTASSLRVRRKNAIKDFVSVAGLLHVTHLCMFSRSAISTYLKLARLPSGPTLTFRIHNYTLAKDVLSSLRRQMVYDKAFSHAPLVVLNNFSGEGLQMKLMASMFQNMFPSINIHKVNLNTIRRCVLLNYNSETKSIDFRHYVIRVVPVGVSKAVKKIVHSKVPNLARFEEMADFLTMGGQLSESEAEDDPSTYVTLSQKISARGNMTAQQSAIRLSELGPRMTLQLIKVEDGLMDGEVLFHELIQKTEEEKLAIRQRREQKRKQKEKRRKMQDANVKKKKEEREKHKEKSLKAAQKKQAEREALLKKEGLVEEEEGSEGDNDAEWYRKEVGQEPEKELFASSGTKKRKLNPGNGPPHKKFRKTDGKQPTKERGMKMKNGKRNFPDGKERDSRQGKFRTSGSFGKNRRFSDTSEGQKRFGNKASSKLSRPHSFKIKSKAFGGKVHSKKRR